MWQDLERSVTEKRHENSGRKHKKKRKGDTSGEDFGRQQFFGDSIGEQIGENKKEREKYFKWQPGTAKQRKDISAQDARNFEVLPFKRRPDLVQFHRGFPGALAAQFLCAVPQNMMRAATGQPRDARGRRRLVGTGLPEL